MVAVGRMRERAAGSPPTSTDKSPGPWFTPTKSDAAAYTIHARASADEPVVQARGGVVRRTLYCSVYEWYECVTVRSREQLRPF